MDMVNTNNANLDNRVKNYNDMIYASRLVKFSDFISNKYNIVHKKIYTMALNKYISEWLKVKQYINDIEFIEEQLLMIDNEEEKNKLNKQLTKLNHYVKNHQSDKKYVTGKYIYDVTTIKEFKDNCFILELMNDEYWKPSLCKITTKFKNKMSPNLSWQVDLTPYWNYYQDNTNKTYTKMKLSDINCNDAKIIDINYIQGKAKLYSEIIDKEFEVDFDVINGKDIEIDDSLSLKNTFNDLLIQK